MSSVIRDERVLRGRDSRVFVAYSAIALTGTMVLGGRWVQAAWTDRDAWMTAIFGLILLALVGTWFVRWFSLPRMRRPVPLPVPDNLRVAAVTTFVPSHEPLALLELTLQAMVGMDVAHDTWVLDEGNSPDVRALCARLGARHFSRAGSPAYVQVDGPMRGATKHGNYNAWLESVGYGQYDMLAMFDPDHVPRSTYLQRTLGFFRDPSVAFVQPPQVYYNQDVSFVARGAAEETYGYHSSHLMASYALGHTVVIGSHGVHRIAALQAVGGFPAHDAEDLFLTMVYKAAGWRGIYVPEVLAMGTTPVDWAGYLRQQLRWSRSVMDLKFRVLPRMAARLPVLERLLNFAHGSFYLRPLLIPVAYLLIGAMILFNEAPPFLQPAAMMEAAGLVALLSMLDTFRQRFYLDPRFERGFHWRAGVMQLAKWPVFVRAALEVLRGRQLPYLLTAKGSSLPAARGVLAASQATLAACMALALWIGMLLHGALEPPLVVAGVVAIVLPLLTALTDAPPAAGDFDPEVYLARRRAQDVPAGRG